jgi:hypothetical protein
MSTEDYTESDLLEMLKELRGSLPINKFDLEVECEEHAKLYDEVGELAAKAKAMSRTAKNEVDFIESDLKTKVRKDPATYGLKTDKKPTNDAINDTVAIQDEVRQAKADYIRISLLADSFSVLQAAMEQRKGNLRNLVTLYVHNYYLAQNVNMGKEKKQLDDDYQNSIAEQRQAEIDAQAEIE